jgi:hypothetical protein
MSLSSMPHILASFHSMPHTPVSQSVMPSTNMGLSSSLLSYICQPTSLPSSYVITMWLLEVSPVHGWTQQGVRIFRGREGRFVARWPLWLEGNLRPVLCERVSEHEWRPCLFLFRSSNSPKLPWCFGSSVETSLPPYAPSSYVITIHLRQV